MSAYRENGDLENPCTDKNWRGNQDNIFAAKHTHTFIIFFIICFCVTHLINICITFIIIGGMGVTKILTLKAIE